MAERIKIENKNFYIDGTCVFNYGGSFHYWRSKPNDWQKIIKKIKELGINLVTTYIPWEIHEVKENVFDFKDSKDINSFLELCSKEELKVMVRPGPQINSEMTWFGFPKRILENKALHAKNPFGSSVILNQVPKPIPALSYVSSKFWKEVEKWYDAICPILKNHLWPNGPIIGIQVDNELGYFFNTNPYTCDYSEASIELYQRFLEEKYENINTLNLAYRSNYSNFYEIKPPKRFEGQEKEDLPYYLDWIEYREYYLIYALEVLTKMLKERSMNVPIYHNYPHPLGPGGAKGVPSTPFNLPKLEEKIDFAGFDIYSKKELYDHIKTISSYVAGCSRYPFIPEFITGVWPWYINPGDVEDEVFDTKAVLMHGIKGFNRYMIVERNKWLGSPIDREGNINEKSFNFYLKIKELLNNLPLQSMKKKCDILLITNRTYDRLEAATALIPVYGDFLDPIFGFSEYPNNSYISQNNFGFNQAIQVNKNQLFEKYYNFLSQEGYTFNIGDSDLSLERIEDYKLIIIPTFEFLSKDIVDKIIKYVEGGGLAIVGPEIPNLDETMKVYEEFMKYLNSKKVEKVLNISNQTIGEKFFTQNSKGLIGRLIDLDFIPQFLSKIFQEKHINKINKNNNNIDIVLYESTNSKQILFVANPHEKFEEVEIKFDQDISSCFEVWEEKEYLVKEKNLKICVDPYSIKIFLFEKI